MPDSDTPTYSSVQVIGLMLGPVLILFFLKVPMGLEPSAARAAAVTALVACWWITTPLPIPVTSLLPIVLFPALGLMPSGKVAKYYADNNIYLFLGGFIIALAIQRWGLHKRIALWIITVVGLSPSRLVLGFGLATAFLSMWISNTATTMMMFPIGLAVISAIEGLSGEDRNFPVALMLIVAYGASIGGIATIIGTPPNIVFQGQFAENFPDGPVISFFDWIKVFLPFSLVFLPVAWLILVKVVAPLRGEGAGASEVIKEELRRLGRPGRAEMLVAGVFLLTGLLWIFRQDINLGIATIPGWSNLFGTPKYLHDATVAVFMAALLFVIPSGEGKFLMDWNEARKIPWGILLLFGGGFAIAGGFKETGLDQAIGTALRPHLTFHPYFIVMAVCALLTFLTEITSNTATAAALLPVMIGMSKVLGINPLLLMIPATISASCAFMLPVATPPNAIVFSSGRISMGTMVRAGILINLVGIVLVTLWIYLVVRPAWGIDLSIPAWALN